MFHRHRLLFRTLPILLALCALPALLLAPARSEGDPVFVGAGDIADCGGSGDEATAALLDSIDGTVFTLGDNAYPDGSTKDFADCYDPSWGRHKARTRPAVGNHEYQTPGGAGYYNYFGAAAGDPAKGYYAYDLGAWRIVVLNGEIDHSAGSTQEQWLRAELTAHANLCTLAIWHEPRFTSGAHGNDASFNAFWQALYQFGADVVLNGHDHHYERFAPQNPSGAADSTYGIREFIVGTGGKSLFAAIFPQPNSQVRNASTYGVLKLTLHAGSYDWEFVPAAGGTFTDSGSSVCHAAPTPPPPTPTPTLTPTPSPHNDILYLSSTLGGSAGGVTFADEDILAYNTASGAWSMVFDGSDVGTKTDLDAFELQSDGSILMSFAASSTNVPGLGAVDDSDIVRFIPTSLGSNTAGTFEWYFDGSDVEGRTSQ